MRGIIRTILVFAIATVVLGAGFFALLYKPQTTVRSGVAFTDAEPTDVKQVSVTNSFGSYRYYHDGEAYQLDDIPSEIFDLNIFIAFLENCSRLKALERVRGENLNTVEYGLNPPAATAEIELFSGETVKLKIGAEERVSQNYYVQVEGRDGIYIMDAAAAQPFLRPKQQVISPYVTPQLAVSSPLSAVRDITFTGGSLAQPVTIYTTSGAGEAVKMAALSFGTATHIVRGAATYQLDQTYGVEVMGSLFGLVAYDIVGYSLTGEQIAELGFDAPYMVAEYDMINGADAQPEHVVLKLVKVDETQFLAMHEGTGAVYLVARPAFADLQYDKLFLRWFLKPMLMDITCVSIVSTSGTFEMDIDTTDSANPVFTCNGQVVDPQLGQAFYRLITGAAHDGSYLGPQSQPSSGEVMRITYTYKAGRAPDVMQLYPDAARRVTVFINGAGEFAMKDEFVTQVQQGLDHLLGGQPIDENWQ